MSNFVSFLFLIKDKRKKGQSTDKNLDGNESEEAEIEEVKNLFFWRRKRIYLRTSKYNNTKHLLISKLRPQLCGLTVLILVLGLIGQ